MNRIATRVILTWGAATRRGRKDEGGQTLTEYALIIALMSLALVASLSFLRGELDQFFSTAIDKF